MSLFEQLIGHCGLSKTAEVEDKSASSLGLGGSTSVPFKQVEPHANRGESGQSKRQVSREQISVAVRETMTHYGVLSASYKFKVLSLDQAGEQFFVLMAVGDQFIKQIEELMPIERKIVQAAKTRFEIVVTSVYWRIIPTATSAGDLKGLFKANVKTATL